VVNHEQTGRNAEWDQGYGVDALPLRDRFKELGSRDSIPRRFLLGIDHFWRVILDVLCSQETNRPPFGRCESIGASVAAAAFAAANAS
jgi:hypothetical protein